LPESYSMVVLGSQYAANKCPSLTLDSANFFRINKECLLIGFYTKMDLYSQPTWPKTGNFYIKQKFIHWATRGRLNNHKDLLGIE